MLYASVVRQARQRDAVDRLLDLVEDEGRYNCDAVASRFAHDLNNMLLVLSMESERLESAAAGAPEVQQQIDILEQVIAEGRDLVERCRTQMAPVESSSSTLCDELEAATQLLAEAGHRDVDVAIARSVSTTVRVSRPARDIHLLMLAMVRAAGAESGSDRLSLMVSTGRDASLPEDANDSSWISLSIVGCESLSYDDAHVAGLSRIVRRLSGEVVLPEKGAERRRLAVSLPVFEG